MSRTDTKWQSRCIVENRLSVVKVTGISASSEISLPKVLMLWGKRVCIAGSAKVGRLGG